MILDLRISNNRNSLKIIPMFPVDTKVQPVERKQYETTTAERYELHIQYFKSKPENDFK
jgi:hypothetical protein